MFPSQTVLRRAIALVCLTLGAGAAHAAATAATTAPIKLARPTGLEAKAKSTTEASLTWADNAADEWEYDLEVRSLATAWREVGAIPPNVTHMSLSNLSPGKTYFFRLRARNASGYSDYSNEAPVTAFYETPPSCVPGESVMCLGEGRYRVEVTYERGTELKGAGKAVGLSQESGLFWFFSPSNVETIIKVLDGCGVNNHRWIYTTGLTDLRVLVLVADTHTGATASYLSQGGAAFAPVTDTEALPCD
jgi:hypothetical protein